MNKLFKMLQESFGSAPQRNGFDLSRRDVFSSKVGMKQPAFVMETIPQDYHEIRPVNLVRSFPMNEANFTRIKQHLDYYFVPMSAFQSNFHEVMQQTTDPVNALLVGDVKKFPTFPICALLMSIAFTHYKYTIGDESIITKAGFESYMHDVFAQGGESFCDMVSQNYSEYWNYLTLFADDFSSGNQRFYPATDMFFNNIYEGTIRLLDMLGYGNYLPFVNIDYSPEAPEEPNKSYRAQILSTLFNLLGKEVNLYRFAAYQCVHQNFGINTIYDKLDIYSFNFDDVIWSSAGWLYRQDTSEPNNQWEKLRCVFTLRYSQWKKDIFTSAYPDSQFGGVSVVSSNYLGTGNVLAGSNVTVNVRGNNATATEIPMGQAYANAGGIKPIYSQFSILDLRRAEALQGWKEDMMRSGFRAKQRQKSQFGVSPSYDPHCMPYILGSVSADIKKDQVTGTSKENFAELAANGFSSLPNQVIKFDGSGRNDFGIIIGIFSIVPEADYDALGIDLHNMKSEAFDFYTPAFQNIGLQALSSFYLNAMKAGLTWNQVMDMPPIHGYVPRYSEYKQAFDKVHGEYCAFPVPSENSDYISVEGSLRSFVSTRRDIENFGLSKLSALYVNPSIVDDIFVVDANSKQNTDQFQINMYNEVKSVRSMSVLGLPRF